MTRQNSLKPLALLLGVSAIVLSEGAIAQTDLADAPLASTTSSVKPNLMFVLDDSGSMAWDYTPDYVNDSSPGLCYDSGSSITETAAACRIGDPPYSSANFNTQYYNPNITYLVPVNADGSSKSSMTSANTDAWTEVPVDGFGISGGSTNLITGYPDRQWCSGQSGSGICVKNADYTYPDLVYRYPDTIYGPPYYYKVLPTEYCDSDELNRCVVSTSPTGAYTYPAILRWCNSNALTDCQARRLGSYTRPKYLGVLVDRPARPGVSAVGTITIDNSGSATEVALARVEVNGVNVISTVVRAATGTNTSAKRIQAAFDLCTAINSHVSNPDYQARNSGTSGTTCSPSGSETVTVIAATAGASSNGYVISPSSAVVQTAAATAVVSVTSAPRSSQIGGVVSVGGVQITNGSWWTASGGTNATRRTSLRDALRDAINAFVSSPEYTAADGGSSDTLIISAALSEGAAANNRPVVVSTAIGAAVTISDCTAVVDAMCGGISYALPTTTTNMTGGVDAYPAGPRRENKGLWARTSIVPDNDSYPRAASRFDCTTRVDSCTYAEEMTNFANWYAYYRTRMQMMKSAAGRAFLALDDSFRVGFNTINQTSMTSTSDTTINEFLPIKDFTPTHKSNWYDELYAVEPNGYTPLRIALYRVGQMYEGALSGVADPVQLSCQQNFTLLTSDGYWNDEFSMPSGQSDQDNQNSAARFCTREQGCFDGNINATNTLSDVALYFYRRDLRSSMENNVPISAKDPNPAQHMTTLTLGLGLDGVMRYKDNYATATSGDFYKIRNGERSCPWTSSGAVCNWPIPVEETATAVDDLWHAAVNGHGSYFSAKDPSTLARSLSTALLSVQQRNGASSASATSTPNVTQEDNDVFSATFRTVHWDGELKAQKIDVSTGGVLTDVEWQAMGLLDAKASASADTRSIYTFAGDGSAVPKRKAFLAGQLTPSELAHFANHCPAAASAISLTQCAYLDSDQKLAANRAENMINYLRGQRAMEAQEVYRNREHILGDIASAKPAYVREPRRTYEDTGYAEYKTAQASRSPMVYVGANDGMLHAFDAGNGQERWAYVPRQLFPKLYRLADETYPQSHQYYVDGSPEYADAYFDGSWRTVLVGGLNKGGRGYYALDVTSPTDPQPLWEFCPDSTLCTRTDSDIGYSYGNPVITKLSDGAWVVIFASGYNNPDGVGRLYVLDLRTGAVLHKVETGVGTPTNPSGLAKITARVVDPQKNNSVLKVFSGDLQGNVWRFDFTSATTTVAPTVSKLITLTNGAATPVAQPITTRPDVGRCGIEDMVYVGTGKFLGDSDKTTTALQSVYGIKDGASTISTGRNALVEQTLSSSAVVSGAYTITANAVDLASKSGWFVDLDRNSGERINLDPALVLGTLLFISNRPDGTIAGADQCTVGGLSYYYELDACTGSFVQTASNQVVGGLLANSLAVGNIVIRLPSGAVKTIVTTSGGDKITRGVSTSGGKVIRRVGWRELLDY